VVTRWVAAARVCAVAVSVLLFACEVPSEEPSESTLATAMPGELQTRTFDAGPVRRAGDYLEEPRFAGADLARGELLGLACAACHKLGAGEGTLVGPNLHGMFGRPAASVAGFEYSPALTASGLVWTPVSLEAWLADPAGFVAGTTMAFAGYRSAADRRDLIAYLLTATQ